MRKFKTLLIIALSLTAMLPLSADEGMWLLPLLEKMNIRTMQDMGCKLSAKDIYDANNTSLKDAVVIFGGGCTGEVISDNGLLITNHHCGYSSIQQLSSVEHDYLTDGYWAMTLDRELPAEGLSVTFLESFTDVTKEVNSALEKAKTPEESNDCLEKVTDELTKKAVGDSKILYAEVSSMFGGNQYFLIVYKVFKDVRFVGAPPSSIGKFGADTDNWMWPRHTCDFSMFRIYADKDNNPADYSEDNVPYHPRKSLAISLKGIQDQDFSMIMGYPGSTNRFMTASEVVDTYDNNKIRIQCRGIRQDLMLEDMLADPNVKIQYASKYSGSSNGWKKWIGMNETFDKLGVQQRRADEEKSFEEWINKKKTRQEKYGNAILQIDEALAERKVANDDMTWIRESLGRIEIYSVALNVVNSMKMALAEKDSVKRITMIDDMRDFMLSFYKDYNTSTDKKIAKAMFSLCRENIPADRLPSIYHYIDSTCNGDIDAYVEDLFRQSAFSYFPKFEIAINKALEERTAESVDETVKDEMVFLKDPAYLAARSLMEEIPLLGKSINEARKKYSEGKKAFIAGQLEMNKGKAMYPDANFTMRLTYGKIGSYSPKDGVLYNYYTTLDGVMQKEDPDNWEFVVPAKLKDLYSAKDFGRYARPEDGKMPACFINNCDITGGNSGSPVLNAYGQLTGLAFDGNWESMSGDVIFEPDYQRCICVDIRYVLFIIEKFGGAGYLLDEMNIVK